MEPLVFFLKLSAKGWVDMLVRMKAGVKKAAEEKVYQQLTAAGLRVARLDNGCQSVFAVAGDTAKVDLGAIEACPGVEKVVPVEEAYRLASRALRPRDTVVQVGRCKIGGRSKAVIAGPCSVESAEQMAVTAAAIKRSGAAMLRGGAYKPRTSPYSFQGLEAEGLKLLSRAGADSGLPVVTEVTDVETFALVEEYADLIQIGARNMQNFPLLKKAGKSSKPILLKRGLSATLDEFLMAAEYILAGGNGNVILCERGIRTFDNYTRNTLDISVVPAIKQRSHLPIIVDPSHASGCRSLVEPLALAALAAGADGLMVEVHHQPESALCDGEQSLRPEQFAKLMASVRKLVAAI